jgi:hypothetical protein
MSSIEERFKDFKYQKSLKIELKDSNGFSFGAKPDIAFVDTYTGLIWLAELKEHELNSIKTIATSQNNLLKRALFLGFYVNATMSHSRLSGLLWNAKDWAYCLKNGWNHSKYKHGIISKALQTHDIKYAVIFSEHSPCIGEGRQEKAFKIHYQTKAKIHNVWLESEFWDMFEEGRFRMLTPKELSTAGVIS